MNFPTRHTIIAPWEVEVESLGPPNQLPRSHRRAEGSQGTFARYGSNSVPFCCFCVLLSFIFAHVFYLWLDLVDSGCLDVLECMRMPLNAFSKNCTAFVSYFRQK